MYSAKERRRRLIVAATKNAVGWTLVFVALRTLFAEALAAKGMIIPYHIMGLTILMGVIAFFLGAGHARLFGTHEVVPRNRIVRAVKWAVYAGPLFIAPAIQPLGMIGVLILA